MLAADLVSFFSKLPVDMICVVSGSTAQSPVINQDSCGGGNILLYASFCDRSPDHYMYQIPETNTHTKTDLRTQSNESSSEVDKACESSRAGRIQLRS